MNTELNVTEGNNGTLPMAPLCVVLNNVMGGLERDVALNLSTTAGTAGVQSYIVRV